MTLIYKILIDPCAPNGYNWGMLKNSKHVFWSQAKFFKRLKMGFITLNHIKRRCADGLYRK